MLVAMPAKVVVNEDGNTYINVIAPTEEDVFPKDLTCWDCDARFYEVFGQYCEVEPQEGFDADMWERIL